MRDIGLNDNTGTAIQDDDQLLISVKLKGRAQPTAFYGVVTFAHGCYVLEGYGPSTGSTLHLASTRERERAIIGNIRENLTSPNREGTSTI